MIRSDLKQREKRARPFCQATGCFDYADVYIVLKETEVADYYEVHRDSKYETAQKGFNKETEFDGFKMILYMCGRHDCEFKYLIGGSELRVAKRCVLCVPQIS